MKILLDTLLWIAVMVLWAYNDAKRNDKGKPIFTHNHGASFLLRYVICFILTIYMLYLGQDPPGATTWHSIVNWVSVMLNKGAISWLVFDPVYALSRRKPKLPWNYLGSTSWLDKIFPNWKVQYIVKGIYLIASTIFRIIA